MQPATRQVSATPSVLTLTARKRWHARILSLLDCTSVDGASRWSIRAPPSQKKFLEPVAVSRDGHTHHHWMRLADFDFLHSWAMIDRKADLMLANGYRGRRQSTMMLAKCVLMKLIASPCGRFQGNNSFIIEFHTHHSTIYGTRASVYLVPRSSSALLRSRHTVFNLHSQQPACGSIVRGGLEIPRIMEIHVFLQKRPRFRCRVSSSIGPSPIPWIAGQANIQAPARASVTTHAGWKPTLTQGLLHPLRLIRWYVTHIGPRFMLRIPVTLTQCPRLLRRALLVSLPL